MRITYQMILQALVDDINSKANASLFGEVTCVGRRAFVIVDADFFIRIKEDSRRHLMEGMRDQWRDRCEGNGITFRTLKGAIIAEM